MSDRDKPVNPFGRGERTIIRPNPGGKLPPAPTSQPPPGEGPAARPGYSPSPYPLPARRRHRHRFLRPAGAPNFASAPAAIPPGRMDIDTRASPGAAAQLPRGPAVSRRRSRRAKRQSSHARCGPAAAAAWSVARGAHAGVIRESDGAGCRCDEVLRERHPFRGHIRSAGNTAKYILCATADDIVQHIPTEERHVWTQYSMLSRFFGERVGGVAFLRRYSTI